jgi:hypothetical protein
MRRVILVFSLLAIALAWPPSLERWPGQGGLASRVDPTGSVACGHRLRNHRHRLFRGC